MALRSLLLIALAPALALNEDWLESNQVIKYDLKEPAKLITAEETNQQLLGNRTFEFTDLTSKEVDVDNSRTYAEDRQHTQVDYKYPDHPNQKEMVVNLLSNLQSERLEKHVRKLSSFHSRNAREYFGESEAEGWILREIKGRLIGYKASSHSIRFVGDSRQRNAANPFYSPYKQQNIIVKLVGHDLTLKEELVILGTYYDTIIGRNPREWAMYAKEKSPGADDNASGCAILLEVLRLFVESGIKLKHTVELHFYTAKETGMQGSEDVVAKYEEEKLKVKGMLNLDRVGHGSSITVIDRNSGPRETNEALTAFVKMLVKKYAEDVATKEIDCGIGCFSDQYSWHKKGYPVAYIVESELTPYYHTKEDTIETINFKLVNEFTKVAMAFLIELGDPIPSASAAKLGLERMKMEIVLMYSGLLYFFWM